MAGGLEWQVAQDGQDAFAQYLRHGVREWLRVDGRERRTIRYLPGRSGLQANQPPPDPAQHRRQRWWLPRCEVAQRQTLDCSAAPGRYLTRRSDDVGSRSVDPREFAGETSTARRSVRQRREYLGRDRQ